MTSLRQLLADQAPVLWIDAASKVVQAGLLAADGRMAWSVREGDAGTTLFSCIEDLGADLGAVRAFVFCEGPGSTLGIRTSAMAIRAWNALRVRPVYAYRSLDLLAVSAGRPSLTFIADARRESWHALTVGPEGQRSPIARISTAALQPPLATPAGFRQWSAAPAFLIEVLPYDLPRLVPAAVESDLLNRTEDPEAFLHEAPTYATWTPQVHQAPVSG